MNLQRYEKLKEPDQKECEWHFERYLHKINKCKNKASYVLGEKYLCKTHAKSEALNLLIESYHEGIEQ